MFPQIKDEMGVKNKWQKFCRRWTVLQAGLWCAVHRVWRKARGRKGAGEGGGGGGGGGGSACNTSLPGSRQTCDSTVAPAKL